MCAVLVCGFDTKVFGIDTAAAYFRTAGSNCPIGRPAGARELVARIVNGLENSLAGPIFYLVTYFWRLAFLEAPCAGRLPDITMKPGLEGSVERLASMRSLPVN